MLANGIHQTCAAPSSTLAITLVASTDDGAIAFSDVFADGQTVQYMIKSSTAANDDWEEGYGTYESTGTKLSRDLPTATYNGTTYDNSSPAKLTFTTAADVWITPTSTGIQAAGWWGNWAGASGDLYERNGDVAGGDIGSGHIPSKGHLMFYPFRKKSANDVKGLQVYLAAGMSGGEGFELYFFDAAPGGGPGNLLATCTGSANPSAGTLAIAFDSSPIIIAPPGEYFVAFIWDKATGTPEIRGRENRLGQSLGASSTSSYVMLSEEFASWALGDGLPTVTALTAGTSAGWTIDIMLWLVR